MTGHGFIFANAVTDNVQGAAQAEYAWGQGYKNAYLLRSPDIEYTQMPLYFAEAFKKLGGTMVGESIYALSQPDFSAEVTKIKQLSPQPDVIVTSAFEPDFPAFIRQLRGAGVTIPVVVRRRHRFADDLRTRRRRRRRGLHLVRVCQRGQPDGRPIREKYKAKFGKAPESIMDALGYDLAKIIEAAVTKADSVEPAKVREALASLENVQGATAVDQLQGRQRHADPAGQRAPHRRRQARSWSSAKAPAPAIVPRAEARHATPPQYAWRCFRSAAWMCATAPSRPCMGSISRSTRARSSPCSAPTAPARPRTLKPSSGWRRAGARSVRRPSDPRPRHRGDRHAAA